jgi:type IV pilus assembly protein PilV
MIRNRTSPAATRRNGGFTLVEAMVALIVLSVGLLGIAALYVETLRANRTSLHRTEAVNLATDIADRMRSNRDLPFSDPGFNGLGFYDCGGACDPAAPPASANAIATADLTDWVTQVQTQLPGGTADVTFTAATATTPAAYVVDIGWDEVGQTAQATFQLRIEI